MTDDVTFPLLSWTLRHSVSLYLLSVGAVYASSSEVKIVGESVFGDNSVGSCGGKKDHVA